MPGLVYQERQQVAQWLGFKGVELTTLFKASRDGCLAATFHRLCDNKGPTLSVAYNRLGCVFGVYCSISLLSNDSWMPDHQTFLFRLRRNDRFSPLRVLAKPDVISALYCYKDYGPRIGNSATGKVEFSLFEGTTAFEFQTEGNDKFCIPNTTLTTGNSVFDWRDAQPADFHNGNVELIDIEVYSVKGKNEVNEKLRAVIFQERAVYVFFQRDHMTW